MVEEIDNIQTSQEGEQRFKKEKQHHVIFNIVEKNKVSSVTRTKIHEIFRSFIITDKHVKSSCHTPHATRPQRPDLSCKLIGYLAKSYS